MLCNKLKLILDGFFKSFDYQQIFCLVADIDRVVVFLNKFYATMDSIVTNENIAEVNIANFLRYSTANQFTDEYYYELISLYASVYKRKIKKTLLCNRIDKYGNQYTCQLNIFPLLDVDGNLIGSYTLSWHVNPLKILRQFESIVDSKLVKININEIDFTLTTREIEIIFLLIYNFSQYEIAGILNVSRGTIQKNIENKLYRKFNVTSRNLTDLIKKAKSYNLNAYFPPTLLQNKVIDLDDCNQILKSIASIICK